jgi:pimeloyl-ACP methyl ester carboxylesterase
MRKNFPYTIFIFSLLCGNVQAQTLSDTLALKEAILPNGITLNYITSGVGEPLVFIHGSLSDYTYWLDHVSYFSKYYHVIAYSRRYNYPNYNPSRGPYSAIEDAEDLAALIKILKLGKVNIVGHSYGALTALFLAIHHHDLVKRLILAEPPAVSLLDHLSGSNAPIGKALKEDIDKRMVAPMKTAFEARKTEEGVEVFIDYVFNDPDGWKKMSPYSKQETLRDATEWDVMMTKGTLFPDISTKDIHQINIPVLLLSGDSSYPFLNLIDAELHQIIPHNQEVILHSGHQMWYTNSDECRALTLDFLRDKK